MHEDSNPEPAKFVEDEVSEILAANESKQFLLEDSDDIG